MTSKSGINDRLMRADPMLSNRFEKDDNATVWEVHSHLFDNGDIMKAYFSALNHTGCPTTNEDKTQPRMMKCGKANGLHRHDMMCMDCGLGIVPKPSLHNHRHCTVADIPVIAQSQLIVQGRVWLGGYEEVARGQSSMWSGVVVSFLPWICLRGS